MVGMNGNSGYKHIKTSGPLEYLKINSETLLKMVWKNRTHDITETGAK